MESVYHNTDISAARFLPVVDAVRGQGDGRTSTMNTLHGGESAPLRSLDRRTQLIWADWMIRHVPEVLLTAARSDLDGLWFQFKPVYLGQRSLRHWCQLFPELERIQERTAGLATSVHNRLPRDVRRRAVTAEECLHPFVVQSYFFGQYVIPLRLHRLTWNIAKLAGEAWWARNHWTIPVNHAQLMSELIEPIRHLELYWPFADLEESIRLNHEGQAG